MQAHLYANNFYVLDLIRLYAYITYNILVEEEDRLEQKYFVMEMVDNILEILITLSYSSTISIHENCLIKMQKTLSAIGGGGLTTNTPRYPWYIWGNNIKKPNDNFFEEEHM